MTNSMSHMGFPLTPRSMMTLNKVKLVKFFWNFATFLEYRRQ